MEDRQIKLFEEDAGETSPPEEGLYLGTSGWSYADWEGTVYPPAIPPGGRLTEYLKRFATVEIDSTFYGTPKGSTVKRWRKIAPRGFLFAAKFPQQTGRVALISKTIRQSWRARGLQEEIERLRSIPASSTSAFRVLGGLYLLRRVLC